MTEKRRAITVLCKYCAYTVSRCQCGDVEGEPDGEFEEFSLPYWCVRENADAGGVREGICEHGENGECGPVAVI